MREMMILGLVLEVLQARDPALEKIVADIVANKIVCN
jgi:hypothetical protein